MSDPGGDAACWITRVCDACGTLVERDEPHACVRTARLDDVPSGPGPDGAVWSLVGERQLDANLVVLGPGGAIGEHLNAAVDVLVVVLSGSTTVTVNGIARPLSPHDVILVPRGARRSVTAGGDGVRYLSLHVARPAPTIGSR